MLPSLLPGVFSCAVAWLAVPPADPDFSKQWALQNTGQVVGGSSGLAGADIGAVAAWDHHPGTRRVVVALIGAGVNPHEEYAGRLLPGYASLLAGGDPYSTLDTGFGGNGTRSAGIIAAARNNNAGIAGLNDRVEILPVRVAQGPSTSPEAIADGLIWAVDQEADIAVILVQLATSQSALADAVQYAAQRDVLVIAPASGVPIHTAVDSDGVYPTIQASLFNPVSPSCVVPVFDADGRPPASACPRE